jgi:hypothetical protein
MSSVTSRYGGTWQHGEKVGYCYPSGLEKTLCKWDIYAPLVTERLKKVHNHNFARSYMRA